MGPEWIIIGILALLAALAIADIWSAEP